MQRWQNTHSVSRFFHNSLISWAMCSSTSGAAAFALPLVFYKKKKYRNTSQFRSTPSLSTKTSILRDESLPIKKTHLQINVTYSSHLFNTQKKKMRKQSDHLLSVLIFSKKVGAVLYVELFTTQSSCSMPHISLHSLCINEVPKIRWLVTHTVCQVIYSYFFVFIRCKYTKHVVAGLE